MLTAEHAREQLKAFNIPDWRERRQAAAARLPAHLRQMAERLLDFPAGYYYDGPDHQRRATDRQQALQALDGLTAIERGQLFEALFPNLARQVEAGWQLLYRLPYTAGMNRRAFRAPGSPSVTRGRRLAWFHQMLYLTCNYEPDVRWLAAWAAYLNYGRDQGLGTLFAAAIDQGDADGQAVFDILRASANGEHPIGAIGRHVTRALLSAARPDGWAFVEGLLLAAQRQEGLRQVVLETVDEAHPEAFRRMLRLILANDLTRFSAALRAAGVWFGFAWEEATPRQVIPVLTHALECLEAPDTRERVLAGDDPQAAYLALWAQAFEDAPAAEAPAARLLADARPAWRFIGVHALSQLGLNTASAALVPALDDANLQVAGYAFLALRRSWHYGAEQPKAQADEPDLFDAFERLAARCPREVAPVKPLVWPWLTVSLTQADVADALFHQLGTRPLTALLPFLPMMHPHMRADVAEELAKLKTWGTDLRALFFDLLHDPNRSVREAALKAIAKQTMEPAEVLQLEALLKRQARDLRRGVLGVLLHQSDPAAFSSVERLLAGKPPQRLAGLELLEALRAAERLPDLCLAVARAYRARCAPVEAETARLERLLADARPAATLDDALGLMDPARRTPPTTPRERIKGRTLPKPRALVTPAALALRASLDALINTHRDTPVTWQTPFGDRETLLGQLGGLPYLTDESTIDTDAATAIPMQAVWEEWWAARPKMTRDQDGLEIVRALAYPGDRLVNPLYRQHVPDWLIEVMSRAYGQPQALDYPHLVQSILGWLLHRFPPKAGAADYALDALETTLAWVPEEQLRPRAKADDYSIYQSPWGRDFRSDQNLLTWLTVVVTCRALGPAHWTEAHQTRLWGLLRWLDEPRPGASAGERPLRRRPGIVEALQAHAVGAATEADLLDSLLGPDTEREDYYWHYNFRALAGYSGRRPGKLAQSFPILPALVERCRQRILEIELARGDRPTAATGPALSLSWSGGMDNLVRLLSASRTDKLVRGRHGGNGSRDTVLSHLIRATWPTEGDTPEAFAQAVGRAGIPKQRLIELALFAPHWARHVEAALGWEGLAAGAWWLHAHTKDHRWHLDDELREAWAAEIGEHTPLSAQDLLDGAVDVAWFHRVYALLTVERWEALYASALYTSGGLGHSRARLFADAMIGAIDRDELIRRVELKRNQDTVRALGLLPLAGGEADLLRRYEVIQAFRQSTRKFGSQRQTSEKLAARIGLENLARTAGYPDPERLEWAMEARAAGDLADGPLTAEAEGVTVTLTISDLGEPQLTAARGTRLLKTIPTAAKKSPPIAALLQRKRDLEDQKRRVRLSLEAAMCRGDWFTAEELQALVAHPVLAAMLSQLVFVGEAGLGYLDDNARALEGLGGAYQALPRGAQLRLAHPHDLLETGRWSEWQHACFIEERIQPFKQVFRELYVLTRAERDDSPLSRRYAGHQVNPHQAMALFTTRGWLAVPQDGVRRTFHAEGLSAWVHFLNGGFTPAEVEGLTLEGVVFQRVGELLPMPLAEVPPRVFSEVMRDVDLVVSVAHRGGVDPEASASTVEMRATLVRETCQLLKLDNVRLQEPHALVDGEVGHYSVHLSSAGVHRLPGGALCIIPVHAQHRGRLFLPFADDDPKTAEVVSKVLLLAKDREIKDPTILEQILVRV